MSANWNNVRLAVYSVGAGVLGAAAALGWITADQGEQLSDALVEILGAVALVVAAANVNKGDRKPATVSVPESDGLPVYDGPTSDPAYVGKHRLEG